MTDKNNEDLFNQLAEQQPVRDIETAVVSYNGSGSGDKSLDEYEQETTHLTDLQFLVKTLSPDFKDEVYNAILVSRISPDSFRPMLRLMINAEIKRHPPFERINITLVAMKIYTILSIALDGKHVIDLLEAFGSAKNDSQMEALSKSLGVS